MSCLSGVERLRGRNNLRLSRVTYRRQRVRINLSSFWNVWPFCATFSRGLRYPDKKNSWLTRGVSPSRLLSQSGIANSWSREEISVAFRRKFLEITWTAVTSRFVIGFIRLEVSSCNESWETLSRFLFLFHFLFFCKYCFALSYIIFTGVYL